MTASIQIKNGKYYIVAPYKIGNKWKQKWFSTNINATEDNREEAEKIRLEILKLYEDGGTNEIKIIYHNKNIDKIEQIETGNWIDLRAAETVKLKAGEFKIISLGVSMKLPNGYEAHIVPRSSTFKKWGVIQVNGMGIIDNSYSGNDDIWGMPVLAMRDTVINENDRICQFRIVDIMGTIKFTEVDRLNYKSRGGFGSTGHN